VGGKNASWVVIRADIPVPGFSVTTEAYNEFLNQSDLQEKIEQILSKIDLRMLPREKQPARRFRTDGAHAYA
jgi:phosphoenolpyruvate synthase/pyruvate phosphate dikinase